MDGQPSGLAATEVLSSTPGAANLLAGTSTNPLDDLVSIFGGGAQAAGTPHNPMGGLSFGDGGGFGSTMLSPQGTTPMTGLGSVSPSPADSQRPQQPQEDILGLF